MTDNDAVIAKETDDSDNAAEKDRHFVTALARGLEILACFKPGERFLANHQLAQRTGLPKPTISRLTYTLTQLGYLSYSETLGKFSLGTAVLSIGNAFLSTLNIRQVARPFMQKLADSTGASVALGSREGLDMVYLERCRSSASSFSLNLDAGSHIPIALTSMGRAYLCGLQETQRTRILDQIKKESGDDWPKIKLGIEEGFKQYQLHGFCLSIGEWNKEVNAVATPFIPVDGSDVLAFSCGGPAFTLRRHILEDNIGPQLVALVQNVQTTLNRVQD